MILTFCHSSYVLRLRWLLWPAFNSVEGFTVLGVIPFASLIRSRAACVVCCAPLSELLEDPARMRSRTASSFFPLLSTTTSGVIRFGTFRGLTDGYGSGLGFRGPGKGLYIIYTMEYSLFHRGACMHDGRRGCFLAYTVRVWNGKRDLNGSLVNF